jgi:hypothetical protein
MEDPKLVARVLEAVKNDENELTIYVDDDYEHWSRDLEKVVDCVAMLKLWYSWDFWTDGCNYANTSILHMAKCSPANETGGFCWRSAVWKFDGAFAAVEASSSTPSGKRPASSSSSSTPSGKRPDSQNESEDTCSICEDAIADTVVLPCMHKCVCQKCSLRLEERDSTDFNAAHCIQCRQTIEQILLNAK